MERLFAKDAIFGIGQILSVPEDIWYMWLRKFLCHYITQGGGGLLLELYNTVYQFDTTKMLSIA